MKTCKNCYHYEFCELQQDIYKSYCSSYKDKDLIFELPCKIGDLLYDISDFVYLAYQPDTKIFEVKEISIRKERGKFIFRLNDCRDYSYSDFGKIVFLDEEIANKEIKRLNDEL